MVRTRKGSNYSFQPDGCGQGRDKTKSRSVKSSSRKTHLEDSRVAPHSPRAEPLSSCRNRNLSMTIQKLVQSSHRRGVGNMPKPLEGGHELLLKHQEKVKKIKNWLKNQSLLSLDQKKELEMTPALKTEGPVVSTSSKPAPEVSKDKPKVPQSKQRDPKNNQGKGKGKAHWNRPYPQGYRIPKLELSAVD
ncbi:hypothetical protein O181_123968, partial [Austropuccinia psidii MF-1]|nr:hypothetical protein [Austropuccinia psidii MF-1]